MTKLQQIRTDHTYANDQGMSKEAQWKFCALLMSYEEWSTQQLLEPPEQGDKCKRAPATVSTTWSDHENAGTMSCCRQSVHIAYCLFMSFFYSFLFYWLCFGFDYIFLLSIAVRA